MPFIALVYVDDHTAAAIRDGDAPWEGSARTVGLFRWPERKDTGHAANCKSSSWSRDPAGWMCCAGCRRRNPKIRQFFIRAIFDFFGANSYPNAPAAFRTPEGYGESFGEN
jgi:hypothetical protein